MKEETLKILETYEGCVKATNGEVLATGKEVEELVRSCRELIAAQLTIHELQHGKYGTQHLGERIRTLEAEKITTAQTIAQKEGEIRRLREILSDSLRGFKCTQRPGIYPAGHWCNRAIQALSSTPPSAVVPWEVVKPFVEAAYCFSPSPGISDDAKALLQSYAPKGKQP